MDFGGNSTQVEQIGHFVSELGLKMKTKTKKMKIEARKVENDQVYLGF